MTKKPTLQQIITIGFAMFAIYFGAGNLIFPPTLGFQAGAQWWIVLLGFAITGVGLPILGVIAIAQAGGTVESLMRPFGRGFSVLIGAVVALCIGPLFCIPRTAATTYEMTVAPLFHTNATMAPALTAVVFFVITAFLTIRQSRVIDIIGRYLTPGLLLILAIIIITAIVNPPGELASKEVVHGFGIGFREGYQTMDAIGSILVGALMIADVVRKGFATREEQLAVMRPAGAVAAVCMALVYGGLGYVGATCSTLLPTEAGRVELLISAVDTLLGSAGTLAIGVAVALACLTTAIGLTSMVSHYFSDITKNRVSYKVFAIGICIFAAFMSILGVDAIINMAVNVLVVLYPVLIVIITMNLFDKLIKYKTAYIGAVGISFIISLLEVWSAHSEGLQQFIKSIPLAEAGFSWFVPAIIFGIIFYIVGMMNNDKWVAKK